MKPLFYLVFILCCLPASIIAEERFVTPLQSNEYKSLTTYIQMMDFLDSLSNRCGFMKVKEIGKSVEGRSIPALFFCSKDDFTASRVNKPLVLIICQQHGNESSGKEAALALAANLASGRAKQFEKFSLIIIPMANPDGASRGIRENARGYDLNRDHIALSQPETVAIHNVFQEWMPEITLDVHEYTAVLKAWVDNGFIKDADVMLGTVTNPNIDDEIITFSRVCFLPEFSRILSEDGIRFHQYIVGNPFENNRMRYSTTAINDARNGMGIYNTLSFILEGKKYCSDLDNIEQRTEKQLIALQGFLRLVDEHSDEIYTIIANARQKILHPSANDVNIAHLQMDYFPLEGKDQLDFPVFNLYTWKPEIRRFGNFHSDVRIKKSVEKPLAYIFSPENTDLIEILKKHNIRMYELLGKSDIKLEIYTFIIQLLTGTNSINLAFTGRNTTNMCNI